MPMNFKELDEIVIAKSDKCTFCTLSEFARAKFYISIIRASIDYHTYCVNLNMGHEYNRCSGN